MKFSKARTIGFTLIELLLGISIFALVALSLYSTLASGIQLNRRSQNLNKIIQEARWSMEQIVHDLENIVPYDFSNSYPDKAAFTGESDRISFILRTDSGLKVVSYYLYSPGKEEVEMTVIGKTITKNIPLITRREEISEEVSYLIREEQSFIDFLQPSDQQESDIEMLSTNIKSKSLKFSYAFLAEESAANNIQWQNQWNQKYIPMGVRVEMTFLWPDNSGKEAFFQKDILIPTGFWGSNKAE